MPQSAYQNYGYWLSMAGGQAGVVKAIWMSAHHSYRIVELRKQASYGKARTTIQSCIRSDWIIGVVSRGSDVVSAFVGFENGEGIRMAS
jgi:hypothetical protein